MARPRTRSLLRALAGLAGVAALVSLPAAAQPVPVAVEPPQALPEPPGEGGHTAPAVALTPDGGALAVWRTDDGQVLGRWLGPPRLGEDAEGGLFVVDDATFSAHGDPLLVRGTDGYLAAWLHADVDGVTLSARAFDGGGMPLGDAQRIGQGVADFDLAARPGGGYAVVTFEFNGVTPPVLLRFLGPDGSVVGDAVEVVEYPRSSSLSDLHLAVEPDGNVLVSWSQHQFPPGLATIWVKPYAPDGEPVGVGLPVVPAEKAGAALAHDLAATGPGRFLLVWAGGALSERHSPRSVRTLELDAWGNHRAVFRLDVGRSPDLAAVLPTLAFAPDGTGVAAWVEDFAGSPRIVARAVASTGRPRGDAFTVVAAVPPGRLVTGLDTDRGAGGWTAFGWGTGEYVSIPFGLAPPTERLSPPFGVVSITSRVQRFRDVGAAEPPPPDPPPPADAAPLVTAEIPGFRTWVSIRRGPGDSILGTREDACLPETLCVSGSVPGRSEVFVRVVGPKPNGFLWPTLVKFTTSPVEVWIEQVSTGVVRYYDLPGASPGFDVLPGLFDRHGFEP